MKNPGVVRYSWLYSLKLAGCYLAIGLFICAPATLKHARALRLATASADSLAQQVVVPDRAANSNGQLTQIGQPTSISFTRQAVVLPVSKGAFSSIAKTWIVARNDVEYITANQNLRDGNPTAPTILYGHALADVLAVSLKPLPNDTIVLSYSSGTKLAYTFVSDKVVLPTDTSVLAVRDTNYLAIITCSGTNNQYRHIGQYAFLGVIK